MYINKYMTRKEKLLAKFKNNPTSVSGAELLKILEWQGFKKEE